MAEMSAESPGNRPRRPISARSTFVWVTDPKEIQPDHVHLFVSIPPAIAVADAVKILKGTTARKLFQRFPWLKSRLWDGNRDYNPNKGNDGLRSASPLGFPMALPDRRRRRPNRREISLAGRSPLAQPLFGL